MRIIVEQDASEVMDENDLYDHSITEVFGEEACDIGTAEEQERR